MSLTYYIDQTIKDHIFQQSNVLSLTREVVNVTSRFLKSFSPGLPTMQSTLRGFFDTNLRQLMLRGLIAVARSQQAIINIIATTEDTLNKALRSMLDVKVEYL